MPKKLALETSSTNRVCQQFKKDRNYPLHSSRNSQLIFAAKLASLLILSHCVIQTGANSLHFDFTDQIHSNKYKFIVEENSPTSQRVFETIIKSFQSICNASNTQHVNETYHQLYQWDHATLFRTGNLSQAHTQFENCLIKKGDSFFNSSSSHPAIFSYVMIGSVALLLFSLVCYFFCQDKRIQKQLQVTRDSMRSYISSSRPPSTTISEASRPLLPEIETPSVKVEETSYQQIKP
jgi:hypothetical protein